MTIAFPSYMAHPAIYIFSSQVATLHPSSVSNVIWSKINIRTMIHSVKPLIRKRFSSNKRQIMMMTIWTNQNKEDDSDDEEFHQSVLTWTMHLLPPSKPLIRRSRSSNQRQIITWPTTQRHNLPTYRCGYNPWTPLVYTRPIEMGAKLKTGKHLPYEEPSNQVQTTQSSTT